MKETYDSLAEFYEVRHDNPWTRRMREAEKPFLKLAHGRILDIGCGTGYHLKLFPGAVGIDTSEEMLKKVKKHRRVLKARAEKLPFPKESFDTILCMFTVLNFCQWKKVVKEISRVLRPGGVCLLSVASVYDRNWNYWRKKAIKHPAREKTAWVYGQKVKLHLFEKKEIEKEFHKNDLFLEKFRGLFVLVNPRWGDFTPLTKKEKILVKLERLFPGRYGCMYFFAFRKPET